jgi:hypothetical protein
MNMNTSTTQNETVTSIVRKQQRRKQTWEVEQRRKQDVWEVQNRALFLEKKKESSAEPIPNYPRSTSPRAVFPSLSSWTKEKLWAEQKNRRPR